MKSKVILKNVQNSKIDKHLTREEYTFCTGRSLFVTKNVVPVVIQTCYNDANMTAKNNGVYVYV